MSQNGGAKPKIIKQKTTDPNPEDPPCYECENPCPPGDKNTFTCNICSKWFHKDCTSVKPSELRIIKESKNINFTCDHCVEKKCQETSDIQKIREMVEQIQKGNQTFLDDMRDTISSRVTEAIDERMNDIKE